ncbi:sensor histidine kinase [Flavobacterium sp. PLA-1-15]|uniref:ATP-binding protein n=1 Tax=Flavobacterium sp. PLA-1-15 TaxID=3380533 RepID=UPI003B78E26E
MKNLYILFVFVFLMLACDRRVDTTVVAPKNDSLAYFFEKANNDSVPYAERQMYTQKAIAIISKDKNDSMNRVNYFKVANRYYNMRNLNAKALEDYKGITLFLIENSIKSKDTTSLIKSYRYMVDYYVDKKNYDSTYIYVYELEKLYVYLKDDINASRILLGKTLLQHSQCDYLGCERTVLAMLKKLRFEDNYELRYEAYNFLGIVYGELMEYQLSEHYYKLALELATRKEIPHEYQNKATTLNNLGVLYRKLNKDDEALKVFNEALNEDSLFVNRPIIFAMIKDNIAYSEFKSGNHKRLPSLFFESLKIRDSLNIVPGIIINNIHLSEYYAFKKDTLKAISYAKRAYDVASENKEMREVMSVLKQLSNVEPKKALQYSVEYHKLDDSLKLVERRIKNKFSRIEYETEELALEKDKLTEHKRVLIYISIGILLLAITVFIIRYQITKNKELHYLQQQKTANEEIYQLLLGQHQKIEEGKQLEKKRISRELHDGVMGRLSGIRLNLFILSKRTDSETIAKCLEHISEIQKVEKEIKTIAYDLEKNVFSDTIGFVMIVKNLFGSMEEHSGLHFTLEMDETIEWELLDGNAKINTYRILQEALQNIYKYAQAKSVVLKVYKTAGTIELAIEDDGIGFDAQKIKKGLGLKNMEERAKDMGGKISISSKEGGGTKINLIIPI